MKNNNNNFLKLLLTMIWIRVAHRFSNNIYKRKYLGGKKNTYTYYFPYYYCNLIQKKGWFLFLLFISN